MRTTHTLAAVIVGALIAAPSVFAAQVNPYTADASTAVLYHLNEPTGAFSSSATDFFIDDASSNNQDLRSNAISTHSPFTGVSSVNGLGTAMTSSSTRRAYRASGNASVGVFNTQTFTIEAWIRNPATSGFPGIFRADTYTPSTTIGAQELVQFGLDTNGDQLRMSYFSSAGVFTAHESSATFSFAANTWYHVAVTYNNGEIRFYVDSETSLGAATRAGTQLGATITGAAAINPFEITDTGDIWVGELESGNNFNGNLDEVRWSNVVRSAFNLAYAPVVVPAPAALPAGLALIGLLAARHRRH